MSFEEESLLVWPDVTFSLYLSFHFVNGVAVLDVQGDRASYHSLDEDLQAGSRLFSWEPPAWRSGRRPALC